MVNSQKSITAHGAVSKATTTFTTKITPTEYKQIYITHVDSLGPYIQIEGLLSSEALEIVQQRIKNLLPCCKIIDSNWHGDHHREYLSPDVWCIYQRENAGQYEYVRARIINVISASTPNTAIKAKIDITDYDEEIIVNSCDLLFPQQPEKLKYLPALYSPCIVLGISEDWSRNQLNEICQMIQYRTVKFSFVKEFMDFKFITMKWKEFNFDEYVILHKNIGAHIDDNVVFNNFAKTLKEYKNKQQIDKSNFQQNSSNACNVSNDNSKNNYMLKTSSNDSKHCTNDPSNKKSRLKSSFTTFTNADNKGRTHPIQNHQFREPNDLLNIRHMNNTMIFGVSGQQQFSLNQQYVPRFGVLRPIMTGGLPITNRTQMYDSMNCHFGHNLEYVPLYGTTLGRLHMINCNVDVQTNPITSNQQIKRNFQHMVNTNTQCRGSRASLQTPYQHKIVSAATKKEILFSNSDSHCPSTIPTKEIPTADTSTILTSSRPQQQRLAVPAFKSNNLTVGQLYEVYISFVENGPFLFSVQLVSDQESLTDMMNCIEKVPLQQFTEKPTLGTACIARYSEDGQLYRALITGVQLTCCKVAYIDYGNTEIVDYNQIYEIPDEFLIDKAFAMRFTLWGYKELEPIDESLKKAFKELVLYKNCKLKVMPLDGPPLVQYCKLYFQQEKDDVLNILKQIQMKRLVYPKAEPLLNNDIVEIRYIDSPRNFYVQKVNNIPAFEQLMDDIYMYYNKRQVVPNNLSLGTPCTVKYENEWYRAEVIRNDVCNIMVRHIDFGYEQIVTKNLMSIIAEEHLKFPRQAIQCCLKGFENKEMNTDSAVAQFEMLAEERNRQRRSFTVKVFRLQPDGIHLVNLCSKDLNVMKKLYKLSMPFEQYLHFEKEDFNVSLREQKPINDDKKYVRKTPSKTSNEVTPFTKSSNNSSRAGPIQQSNLKTDEKSWNTSWQPENQKGDQPSPLNPVRNNYCSNTGNSIPIGWDDQNSPNLCSTSCELKPQKKNKHNNNNYYNKINRSNNTINNNNINSDKSTTFSGDDKYKSSSSNLQSHQQNKNLPHNKNIQQQRTLRPRNAPQGFSQHSFANKTYNKSSKDENNILTLSNVPTNDVSEHKTQHKQQKALLFGNNVSSAEQHTITISRKEVIKCTEVYMPLNQNFPIEQIITPKSESVIISWWISPHLFYTHLKSRIQEFEHFMQSIQQFYENKPLQQLQLKIGSNVMARHREDNIIYRARILGCNQMLRKYQVLFVDVGNQYTVTSEDIWQVEQRFFYFPVMAYLSSFRGIISTVDHLYIIDCMEKHVPPNAHITCDYIERSPTHTDLYYVNIKVNQNSLRDLLINDGLITYVSPELRLDLLSGQQVRATVFAIKDMLNFKIKLSCNCSNIEYMVLLSSYDDIRFVKSNQALAKQFKNFYENKSCVLNIKDVTRNKVLLLRPLMPLMKEDLDSLICTPPIVLETFNVRIVYVASPYRLYGQMISSEKKMVELLDAMYSYYETEEKGSLLKSFDFEQICAAKSSDGNWYRARIISKTMRPDGIEQSLVVYYLDYGNTESVTKENLKYLEENFYKDINAYGLEINLPIQLFDNDHYLQQPSHQQNQTDVEYMKSNDNIVHELINYLSEAILNKNVKVKVLEMRRNHLIAELMHHNQNIVDMLKKRHLIVKRNIDYIRNILDKEKPNMLEYVEMVDLTLEDDGSGGVDIDKKHKAKAVSTSIKEKDDKDSCIKVEICEQNLKSRDTITVVADPQPTITNNEICKNSNYLEENNQNLSTCKGNSLEKVIIESKESYSINKIEITESAVLAHCDNPAQFFIHPMDKIKDLNVLQENLQIIASSLPPLMRIVNDAYCISMYSVDKQWYRAKILDAELMVLQFIDFGNTDCVSDASDLKEMLGFPNIEPLCIPCALPIQPNGTADWVDAANSIFNYSYDKVLNFKYILDRRDVSKKNFIDLYIEGVNVTEHLIKEGYAQPLQLVDSGETCFISHVNAINDFYIQYEKTSKALELIELYFGQDENLLPFEEFIPKKIIAALFPDDNLWYRAQLLKETKDGYEVLFIDYGNTSIITQCREIAEKDITLLPPLSQKCSLELPDHCLNWSEAAEEKFREIAATGETIFTVKLREPANNHAVVHLLIDGHNIIDDLQTLCYKRPIDDKSDVSLSNSSIDLPGAAVPYNLIALRKCVITHAISPSNFYIQLGSHCASLNLINTYIRNDELIKELKHLDNAMIGQLCIVYYAEDERYYRGRIIKNLNGKYEIFLIDYGNTIFATHILEIPQHLSNIPELALHCQLHTIPTTCNDRQLEEYFTSLLETHFGDIYDIEFINDINSAYDTEGKKIHTVKLHVNYKDLAEELLDVCKSSSKLILDNKTRILLSQLYDADFICINSPQCFYIQLSKDTANIQKISERLGNAEEELPSLHDLEVGNKCIAQFPDNGAYYRAEIVQVLDDRKCEVHFIDYGNNSITDQLRKVPEDLLNVEPYSKYCSLDITCPTHKQFKEQFLAFMDSRFSETFQIEFLKITSMPNIVRVFYRGNNIIQVVQEKLKQEEENVETGKGG